MRRSKKKSGQRLVFDHLEARRLLSLVLSPINVGATTQTPFDGVVATLVNTSHKDSPSSFTTPPGSVQINWGDGHTTAGQVVGPVFPGVFDVEGSHAYTSGGGFSTQITVTDQSGNNAIANGSAIVTSQPPQLIIAGQTIAGTAGQPLTDVTVATFLDSNTADTASDFQALITWGNGDASIGDVQGGNGAFTVSGTETYLAAGTYPTNVTVLDQNNGNSVVATGQADIAPASPYVLAGDQIIETAAVAFTTNVATFTDSNPGDTASDFSAAINWGNGHTSTGQVTGSAGNFTISGSYDYAVPGFYDVIVSLADHSGGTAETTGSAIVTGPVLTPLPTTITPSIGQPFTGIVASFFDTNTADTAADLKATVTWGDGHVSAGTVVPVPGSPELFDVQGSDTYTAPGNYQVGVVLVNSSGQTATATSSAIVAAPILIATGTAFPATPGVLLDNITVANFTDTNPNASAGNLTAVINWGDGTTSSGTVNGTVSPGSFTVTGSHIYSAPASTAYSVTVTIADPSGQSTTASSTAIVAMNIAAAGTTFSTTPGVALSNQLVATFTDPNVDAASSTAVINWGDGQTSIGSVAATGTPGTFTVTGNHTYTASSPVGFFPVIVTIADPGGQVATANSTALIATPVSSGGTTFTTTAVTFTTTPGVALPSGTIVAKFTDSNKVAINNPSAILAVINWGDGQTSDGTVSLVGMSGTAGSFIVTGNHTYSALGTAASYPVTVQIDDHSGQTAMIKSTAIVIPFINATGTTFSTTPGVPLPTSTVLANFTDTNPAYVNNPSPTTLPTAVINWGDGQTSAGQVNFVSSNSSGGTFTVTGTHLYAAPSTASAYAVTVTILDPSGQAATTSSTATVTTPAAASGTTFAVTPGKSFTQTVANFTDTNTGATVNNITAVISWGDGQTSAGQVSGTGGIYSVSGTHTYSAPGMATYKIVVTIVNPSGQTLTVNSTAIATALINATGTTFDAIPGQSFTTTVATFTDSNPAATTNLPTAVISWGDGQTSTTTATYAAGIFTVTGTHTYSAPGAGSYSVTVTILDPSGQTATATSTAITASTFNATGTSFTAALGQTFTAAVANFTDTNANANSKNITALIIWGDGQSSLGQVSGTAATGYTVMGTHSYATVGTTGFYPVTVTIADPSGQTAVATSTALIATPTLIATGTTFDAIPGQSFTTTVATFTDSNPAATTDLPTAVISWGDGQTSTTTATYAAGIFTVTGTHTYSAPGAGGSYSVTATILDPSGQTATAKSTALTTSYINATGTTFSATPGAPLPSSTVLANFTDSNPAFINNLNPTTLPTAVINWGDGQTSAGMVNFVSSSSSGGTFTVTGTHTYSTSSLAASYPVTVTILDPSGQTATTSSTAIVLTLATLTPIPTTAYFTVGVLPPAPVLVGSFLDTNTAALAGQFTASINWGDGNTSPGTVTASPTTPGLFLVSGVHLYATPSNDEMVAITVQDQTGHSTLIVSTAIVSPITTLTPFPTTVNFTTGAVPPAPVLVGSFFDSNTAALASQFTASINWNDGTSNSPGTVTASPTTPGLFLVSGTHLYAVAGNYTIGITVKDQTGHSTPFNSTAIVTTYNVPGPMPSGGLANIVSNGPHAAAGFTNTNRPTFTGTAAPYSTVQLYARHFNTDAELPLGEAVAAGNGQWTLATGPLAVGTYIVTATSTVPGGYPSNMIPLKNTNGTDLVYIDLTPKLVRWLSHGHKSVPHPKVRMPHPKAIKPQLRGHHRA